MRAWARVVFPEEVGPERAMRSGGEGKGGRADIFGRWGRGGKGSVLDGMGGRCECGRWLCVRDNHGC